MRTVAIANHKGGVGKTTTAYALGAGLAELGYRVLLVDIDPQASLSHAADVQAPGESMAEVLGGAAPGTLALADILVDISDVESQVLHLAPADIALSPGELGIIQRYGRESLLKNALATVDGRYDVALVDCPPSLSILTINALAAADTVITPTQPQMSDLRGLSLFLETIGRIREQINPDLTVLGVLVTFYDGRTVLHRDALETLRSQGLPLFDAVIGRAIALAEAAGSGESILSYSPDHPQAQAYRQLANEVDEWLKIEAK